MAFIDEPDFTTGSVDSDVVIAQYQFGKFEQGCEGEIIFLALHGSVRIVIILILIIRAKAASVIAPAP